MATTTRGVEHAQTYRGEQLRAGGGSRRVALFNKEWFLFILFVIPNFFFLTLFTYWPMLENVRLSLQRTNTFDLAAPGIWVGLENYAYIFTSSTFMLVLRNTVVFIGASVFFTLGFGLLFALLLNEKLRFRTFARATVFAPFLLSGAAIGIVWAYIFDPNYGLLAEILGWIGVTSPAWLNRPEWALPAIIIVYVWKNLGFATVIFLAGLQAIPQDLYDAAKLDGAGPWWRLKSITIPMLSPISFFLLVTSVLATFQAFDIQQVMTEGGPAFATTTLVYYVYDQAFGSNFNYGRAAAAAIVLFTSMLIVTMVQMRYTERKVHYDG